MNNDVLGVVVDLIILGRSARRARIQSTSICLYSTSHCHGRLEILMDQKRQQVICSRGRNEEKGQPKHTSHMKTLAPFS